MPGKIKEFSISSEAVWFFVQKMYRKAAKTWTYYTVYKRFGVGSSDLTRFVILYISRSYWCFSILLNWTKVGQQRNQIRSDPSNILYISLHNRISEDFKTPFQNWISLLKRDLKCIFLLDIADGKIYDLFEKIIMIENVSLKK